MLASQKIRLESDILLAGLPVWVFKKLSGQNSIEYIQINQRLIYYNCTEWYTKNQCLKEDKRMIKIYENEKNDWVCELWGGSTKHPDSKFLFSDFKTTDMLPKEFQVYQWLLECASKLTWPMFAHELVQEAEKYYLWDKDYYMVHVFTEGGDAENGPKVYENVELILAKSEEEAVSLVSTHHYMKDRFIVDKYDDDMQFDTVDGIRAEKLEFTAPEVNEWFEGMKEDLPF